MRVRTDAEFKALRFETDVVELGTALLSRNDDAVEALKESVRTQVEELPLTVNVVAKEKPLIDRVLKEAWWKGADDAGLRELVQRLGPLMKYRQRHRDPILKLDLEDAVVLKEYIEFGPEHERLSTAAYRERVETYIRTLVAENPVLQKIQRGEEVSETELRELASLLRGQDPYITEEQLRQVYDARTANFLQLLRHVLGLELVESWSAEITRAFDDFIGRHNDYSALQIRFIQTLRTFILQTGLVEKSHLIERPFTQIHPQGIRGVFRPAEIEEILQFVGRLATS